MVDYLFRLLFIKTRAIVARSMVNTNKIGLEVRIKTYMVVTAAYC